MAPISTDGPAILLLDVGNTNLKWAWLRAGQRSAVESAAHHQTDIVALAADLWGRSDRPERLLIASVAGEGVARDLGRWSREQWGLEPEFVTSRASALGVENGYRQPERLGVDRWLTLVALRRQEQGPVCVVDCGTAITIDVMDAEGKHLGGLILPGLTMMREALLAGTQLPEMPISNHSALLAQDTADAINAGGIQATAALIERVVEETGQQPGGSPRVVLTGSDAPHLAAALKIGFEIDRELVMRGLAVVAQSEELT